MLGITFSAEAEPSAAERISDCFQYFEVVVQCCQFCRGDRAEYPEQVHEIDIVNQVRGEVKRFFYQIKTEVVVQAHEYP